jgi:hypothetical protein
VRVVEMGQSERRNRNVHEIRLKTLIWRNIKRLKQICGNKLWSTIHSTCSGYGKMETFTLKVKNLGVLIKGELLEECHYFEQELCFLLLQLKVVYHTDSSHSPQSTRQLGERCYKPCHHISNWSHTLQRSGISTPHTSHCTW